MKTRICTYYSVKSYERSFVLQEFSALLITAHVSDSFRQTYHLRIFWEAWNMQRKTKIAENIDMYSFGM